MMKIGQPTDKQLPSSIAAQVSPVKGGQSDKRVVADESRVQRPASAGVAVTVSSLARSLASTSQGDSADVDLAKVDAVRTAILKKQFQISPEAIADKLLSNAQEMLSRQRT
jgi:negative regulator of flagellin synthesis FlgM